MQGRLIAGNSLSYIYIELPLLPNNAQHKVIVATTNSCGYGKNGDEQMETIRRE
jgi:hypothetical protein